MNSTSLRRTPVISGRVYCTPQHTTVNLEECADCRLRVGFDHDEHDRTVVLCAGDGPGARTSQPIAPRPTFDAETEAAWRDHVS